MKRRETTNGDVFLLIETMASILGLAINLRIETDVVKDDGVGGRQVDAHASSARRKQKYKDRGVFRKVVDDGGALAHRRGSIEAGVSISPQLQQDLEDVEHPWGLLSAK